jgi:hypothetical protein
VSESMIRIDRECNVTSFFQGSSSRPDSSDDIYRVESRFCQEYPKALRENPRLLCDKEGLQKFFNETGSFISSKWVADGATVLDAFSKCKEYNFVLERNTGRSTDGSSSGARSGVAR